MDAIRYSARFELPLILYGSVVIALALVIAFTIMRVLKKRRNDSGISPDAIQSKNPVSLLAPVLVIVGLVAVYTFVCWVSVRAIMRLLSRTPHVVVTHPTAGGTVATLAGPMTFEVDVPVDFRVLAVNSNPQTPLEVTAHGYLGMPYGRKITITPLVSFPSDQTIMVYLSNMKNPFNSEFGSEALLEFSTPQLPAIAGSAPANDATDVGVNEDLIFTLTESDIPQVAWEVTTDPQHSFELKRGTRELTVDIVEPLKQGTPYRVTVFRTPVKTDTKTGTIVDYGKKTQVHEYTFTTVKTPLISSMNPQGRGVLPTEAVEIVFDEPMDTVSIDANVKIIPDTQGRIEWSADATILRFVPETSLRKDTEYTITLPGGTASRRGGILEEDITFRFRTLGAVTVVTGIPDEATPNVSVSTPIAVTFNQEVDHGSAQQKFATDPTVSGLFSWQGNIMVFTPASPLAFGKVYSYRIESGIKSIHGLDSTQGFTSRFRTASQEFALSVPYFRQEENFTCNIAALRMLLAHRGVTVAEQELKGIIGSNGTRGNGNPYKNHVTDYGTYWDAIEKGVRQFRPYRIFKDWSFSDLIGEVQRGNPVMVWGQNGWSDPHDISWTATDGTHVYAVNGMHSYIVRGFRGSADNPTHILVNDPWRGVYSLPTDEFMRRWNYFRVALVVD